MSIAEQEAHGTRATVPDPASVAATSTEQTYSPYGQWQPVEDPAVQMPDLQLPVTEAAEEETENPVPAEQAGEISFEEKVVEKKISNGSDAFKKRQVKPASRRNVRKRESSP